MAEILMGSSSAGAAQQHNGGSCGGWRDKRAASPSPPAAAAGSLGAMHGSSGSAASGGTAFTYHTRPSASYSNMVMERERLYGKQQQVRGGRGQHRRHQARELLAC